MWYFFSASIVGICISIGLLVRQYASPTVSAVVRVVTGYSWLMSMCIVALVPVDVWSTLVENPQYAILVMWNISYWSTQALSWLILPFYQYYSEAGDFTVWGKCKRSLRDNAILYGSVAGLGAIGILVLLATHKFDMNNLLTLGVFLSNMFGLVAHILLLGYGLVEIPRSMWKSSNPEVSLKWCAHRAAKFAENVMRSTQELDTVVTIIYANQRQMRRTDPLKPYMDIIANYAEKESPVKPSELATRNVDIEHLSAEDLEYNYDKSGLADLRGRLFEAIHEYKGTRAQYEEVMVQAFELENIIKCRQNHEYTPVSGPNTGMHALIWKYKCAVRPWSNKVNALLLAALSIMIVWSESTITIYDQSGTDLSPFSLAVKSVAEDSQFAVYFLILPALVYICACTYFALFRITAFNYNKLIPRASTGAALMQNATLMCRFAAPVCWNFLHILCMFVRSGEADDPNAPPDTQFSIVMRSMDQNLGFNVNIYLPIILAVHCTLCVLNLWERVFSMCIPNSKRFSASDDIEDEYTEKGRQLIRKEQEASLKGYRIGEVLHSAYFDLEFPSIAAAGKPKHRKGMFSFLGTKKKQLLPEGESIAPTASASGPSQMSKYTGKSQVAQQVAGRWLNRGANPNDSSNSLDSLATASINAGTAGNNARSMLFGGSGGVGRDAGGSSEVKAGGGGGLDGIFAGLGRAAPKPSGDTTSLLSGWGR